MRETSKAMVRRAREDSASGIAIGDFEFLPWSEIFKGRGVDVGSGDDPLFTNAETILIDLPDGSGDDVTRFVGSNEQFDFVHGSQVLEHAIDPAVMLRSWLKVLKPGGYIVATVPDWELYEKMTWPSKWNAGHRSMWTMNAMHEAWLMSDSRGIRINLLPEWLKQFGAVITLCRLVTTDYDHSLAPDVDQTFDFEKGVEAFIEFVLQKTT